jgi:hypothetical protein
MSFSIFGAWLFSPPTGLFKLSIVIMKVSLAVGALLLPLLTQASPSVEVRDAAVSSGILTTSGVIVGHAAANKTGVTEYLGIPYAASTNGSQRWMPPQRFTSRAKFNASTYVSYEQ